MSTLFTTTSSSRPTDPTTGDMYFETDTSKIILYNGLNWSEYSPATEGESVDESITIEYASSPDDLFTNYTEQVIGNLYYARTANVYFNSLHFIPIGNNENISISYKDVFYTVRARVDTSTQNNYDFVYLSTDIPTSISNMIAKFETTYPSVFGSGGTLKIEDAGTGSFSYNVTRLEDTGDIPHQSSTKQLTTYYNLDGGLAIYNTVNQESEYSTF